MSKAQAVTVWVVAVVAAVTLHFYHCRWTTRAYITKSEVCLAGTLEPDLGTVNMDGPPQAFYCAGLLVRPGISVSDAIVYGLVAPIIATGVVIYVALGQRRLARLAAGLCESCGYSVTQASPTRCSECGLPVTRVTGG